MCIRMLQYNIFWIKYVGGWAAQNSKKKKKKKKKIVGENKNSKFWIWSPTHKKFQHQLEFFR